MSPRIQGGARKTRMIDRTTFSPKAIAAVIAAVVGYIVGQEALDLPVWAEVAGQAVLVGVAAYAARPGAVVTDTTARPRARASAGERGQTNVWFLLGALTVAVVVLAVVVLT